MAEADPRYTAMRPEVTFNIVDFAKADLEQKLQAQLASVSTQGLPDIVLIEDYGAQEYLQSFRGSFEPLDDAVDYSGVTGLFCRTSYLTGVWMAATIKANEDQSGTWGVAPLPKLKGVEGATHASNMVATVLATLPTLVIFFLLQRRFVEGLLGSVK